MSDEQRLSTSQPANNSLEDYGSTFPTTSSLDAATEAEHLKNDVAYNITTLYRNWKSLKDAIKEVGSDNDTLVFRQEIYAVRRNSNAVIHQTMYILQKLRTLIPRYDKRKKLELEKLSDEFKEIETEYRSAKEQIERLLNSISLSHRVSETIGFDHPYVGKRLKHEEADSSEKILEKIQEFENNIIDVNRLMEEITSKMTQHDDHMDHTVSVESAFETTEVCDIEKAESSRFEVGRRNRRIAITVFNLSIITFVVLVLLICHFVICDK